MKNLNDYSQVAVVPRRCTLSLAVTIVTAKVTLNGLAVSISDGDTLTLPVDRQPYRLDIANDSSPTQEPS